MAHLENWSLRTAYREFTTAPVVIYGTVTGHAIQPDGTFVSTSKVEVFDIEARTALTKSGTNYTLGQMDKEYEQWFAAQKEGK